MIKITPYAIYITPFGIDGGGSGGGGGGGGGGGDSGGGDSGGDSSGGITGLIDLYRTADHALFSRYPSPYSGASIRVDPGYTLEISGGGIVLTSVHVSGGSVRVSNNGYVNNLYDVPGWTYIDAGASVNNLEARPGTSVLWGTAVFSRWSRFNALPVSIASATVCSALQNIGIDVSGYSYSHDIERNVAMLVSECGPDTAAPSYQGGYYKTSQVYQLNIPTPYCPPPSDPASTPVISTYTVTASVKAYSVYQYDMPTSCATVGGNPTGDECQAHVLSATSHDWSSWVPPDPYQSYSEPYVHLWRDDDVENFSVPLELTMSGAYTVGSLNARIPLKTEYISSGGILVEGSCAKLNVRTIPLTVANSAVVDNASVAVFSGAELGLDIGGSIESLTLADIVAPSNEDRPAILHASGGELTMSAVLDDRLYTTAYPAVTLSNANISGVNCNHLTLYGRNQLRDGAVVLEDYYTGEVDEDGYPVIPPKYNSGGWLAGAAIETRSSSYTQLGNLYTPEIWVGYRSQRISTYIDYVSDGKSVAWFLPCSEVISSHIAVFEEPGYLEGGRFESAFVPQDAVLSSGYVAEYLQMDHGSAISVNGWGGRYSEISVSIITSVYIESGLITTYAYPFGGGDMVHIDSAIISATTIGGAYSVDENGPYVQPLAIESGALTGCRFQWAVTLDSGGMVSCSTIGKLDAFLIYNRGVVIDNSYIVTNSATAHEPILTNGGSIVFDEGSVSIASSFTCDCNGSTYDYYNTFHSGRVDQEVLSSAFAEECENYCSN